MQHAVREKERHWKTSASLARECKGEMSWTKESRKMLLCFSFSSLASSSSSKYLYLPFSLSLSPLLCFGEKEKQNGVKELNGVGSWL